MNRKDVVLNKLERTSLFNRRKLAIVEERNKGKTWQEIAEMFGISRQRICQIYFSDDRYGGLSIRAKNALIHLEINPTKDDVVAVFKNEGICFVNRLVKTRNVGTQMLNKTRKGQLTDTLRVLIMHATPT